MFSLCYLPTDIICHTLFVKVATLAALRASLSLKLTKGYLNFFLSDLKIKKIKMGTNRGPPRISGAHE